MTILNTQGLNAELQQKLKNRKVEYGRLNLSELGLTEDNLKILINNNEQLFKGLGSLSLYKNQLSALPEEIGKLTELTHLYLYNNQLSALPEEIGNLTNLRELDLDNNRLPALPEEIGNLTELTHLNLSNNQLTALPEEIGNLTELRELDLDNNRLPALPADIGKLTELTHLNLSNNQLTALPEEIGNLTELRDLSLDNNPLSEETRNYIDNALRQIHHDRNQISNIAYNMVAFDQQVNLNPIRQALGFTEEQYGNLDNLIKASNSIAENDRSLDAMLNKMAITEIYKYNSSNAIPAIKGVFNIILADAEQKEDSRIMLAVLGAFTGDCPTPINDFIVQQIIVQNKNDLEKPEFIGFIEKEAVRYAITTKLNSSLKPNEKIEQVEGLLNKLYLEAVPNPEITNRKNFQPSGSNYISFADGQINSEQNKALKEKFFEMVASKNMQNEWARDNEKIEGLVSQYKEKTLGIRNQLANFKERLQEVMQSDGEKYGGLFIEADKYVEMTDEEKLKAYLKNQKVTNFNNLLPEDKTEIATKYLGQYLDKIKNEDDIADIDEADIDEGPQSVIDNIEKHQNMAQSQQNNPFSR